MGSNFFVLKALPVMDTTCCSLANKEDNLEGNIVRYNKSSVESKSQNRPIPYRFKC